MVYPTTPSVSCQADDDLGRWIALQAAGFGYRTVARLRASFGSLAGIWRATADDCRSIGASPEIIARLTTARAASPERVIAAARAGGSDVLTPDDSRYPPLVRETGSPPLVLYVRGPVEPLVRRTLTVVGTRHPSPYGLTVVRQLVEPLARQQTVIVSGLAYGVDAADHEATLVVHGTTIAVLGSGIDVVYPRGHAELAERIVSGGGSILSEFPPGSTPERHHFPQRNRIMAGMAPVTLVIEAGLKSGAMITARMAADEGREVLAVPGAIGAETSAGTNELLKQGAGVATSPDDIRRALGLDPSVPTVTPTPLDDVTSTEAAVLQHLDQPRHVDELVALSTLDASVVTTTLSLLELRGRVRHLGGMHYARS